MPAPALVPGTPLVPGASPAAFRCRRAWL